MLDYLTKTLEQPEWAKDRLTIQTETTDMTWGDRLRVLLKGRFSMRVDVFVENEIGRNEGHSIFSAPRIRKSRLGTVAFESEPERATNDGGSDG